MSDDLNTAYLLGVEHMRDKLHKQADEIERLSAENEKFFKQAEMNARLLTENASLRAENVQLLLELDMQQATILVPSNKDDQRRIERLNSALKEALDEAAQLRRDVKTAIMGDSAELQDVKRENAKLRKALKPFAYYASQIPEDVSNTASASGTVGDLRAAAAAIRESGE